VLIDGGAIIVTWNSPGLRRSSSRYHSQKAFTPCLVAESTVRSRSDRAEAIEPTLMNALLHLPLHVPQRRFDAEDLAQKNTLTRTRRSISSTPVAPTVSPVVIPP